MKGTRILFSCVFLNTYNKIYANGLEVVLCEQLFSSIAEQLKLA